MFYLNLLQNDKDVRVTATCIRVPVMRAHAESVNLQFEKPLDEVIYVVMLYVFWDLVKSTNFFQSTKLF